MIDLIYLIKCIRDPLVFNTFHFHDSIVRNILALSFFLGLNPGLIVLLRGHYNDGLSCHTLERANFTFLSIGKYICLLNF